MENRVEADKPQCVHAAREAQAPSGCAHQHFEKATEMLSEEHRVIERVLAVVEKLTTNPRGERDRELEEGARFLSLLRGSMPSS